MSEPSFAILITGVHYVSDEQAGRLRDAGYAVHRLREAKATEDQLRELIGPMDGYIHGGGEKVTRAVVDAAARLRGIAFCGSGWTETIVDHESLTERGIPIATTAGSNAEAVAQYTISLITAALRRIPYPRPSDDASAFLTGRPHEWGELGACVLGAGHIGTRVAELLGRLGFRTELLSRAETGDAPAFARALARANVVVLCVSKAHGEGVLGVRELAHLRDGALVVNPVFPQAVDPAALQEELASGRLAAAVDTAPSFPRADLPPGALLHSEGGKAYDTVEALRRTGDWAVESMLNLLERGDDARVVNPGFRAR